MSKDPDGKDAFDFIIGTWTVSHRRLKARLAGSMEWEEFGGHSVAQKILGGLGNFDDNIVELPAGTYNGATLRTYDPKTREWRIYWFDSRMPGAPVDPPLTGKFENGVGTFYSDETFNGKPIKVRFVWTITKEGKPHWQQAFSPDGGKTWEVNWMNEFTRVSA